MGHTVHYTADIERWDEFVRFIKRICLGLGWGVDDEEENITVFPPCYSVEPLAIRKKGRGFAKTNLVEPCHSVYLLILYSASSFGSVSVWED